MKTLRLQARFLNAHYLRERFSVDTHGIGFIGDPGLGIGVFAFNSRAEIEACSWR
jgi:hypothetical protein